MIGNWINSRPSQYRAGWCFFWVTAGVLLFSGCSAAHYRRAADKETYRIIRQVEDQLFKRTNNFSIDTRYSTRKPTEILPSELIADRQQTNQRALTVESAIEVAAQSSRRYQTEKERLYLTALTLTGSRYAFSPQFFGASSSQFDRSGDPETSLRVRNSLGFSKALMTGGTIGASIANDLLRYYTGDPQRSVVSTISVNLAQPLLRGFGRNSGAVENLTQAERNVIYAVRNYDYFQDSFALEIVTDYFSLLQRKDTIRNRYANYLSRVQSTERLRARQDREKSQDVDQARQAELAAKNNYVDSVASFRNALDQFKIKLGLPLGEKVFLDDSALRELEQAGLMVVNLNPDTAFSLATQKQLPILNAIDKFEDSKRKVRVAADSLKTDLKLVADASLRSQGPTDYTKFDASNFQGGVGLELNLPFDRLDERNNYRATIVSFEAEIRNLTQTLDTLKDSIERGLRTLEQRRQNYQIQKNALELANRRVKSTTLLQQAGRAEVRDIVDSQDAQISAQNAVTAAIIDYQVARLQLMLDIGALESEKSHFWLQDHLGSFLPASSTGAAPAPTPAAQPGEAAQAAEESVVPPEEYFAH